MISLASVWVIYTTPTKNRRQITISSQLLVGLFLFLIIILTSALINNAGIINAIIQFLLLGEPFIFLIATIAIPLSESSLSKLKTWIVRIGFFHLILAISQYYIFTLNILPKGPMTLADNVQGIFYISYGGHVVGASVGMAFALYYLTSVRNIALWLRILVFFAAFYALVIADAKQVLLVWFVSFFILFLINLNDIKKTLQYAILIILSVYFFLWAIQNVAFLNAFNAWLRPELFGPQGEATQLKLVSLEIIPSYYQSFLNWLFGLGPGHSIGRLGGWMLPKYWNIFEPLGATIHPASEAVFATWRGHWLDSSFFSPLWGWAGIWGDFGLIGLGAYLYLGWLVWKNLCRDNFSKFILLTVVVNGFIFTLMEEPGFMLFVAFLIAVKWHEIRIDNQNQY